MTQLIAHSIQKPKPDKLVIAQVTDIHIGANDTTYIQGIDVRQQFREVLAVLASKQLDLLVISGDLAAVCGEPEAYQWIAEQLKAFPYPHSIMTGNHDVLANMITPLQLDAADIQDGLLYYKRRYKNKTVFFLDTASYRLAEQQLIWLEQELANVAEEAILFIHHPPTLCGCLFMDVKHSLKNINEVWPTLASFSQIKHVFCGHYHTEKDFVHQGKWLHLTPSTMIQLDPTTPHFKVAHSRAGWRIIEWGQEVNTYVEYL